PRAPLEVPERVVLVAIPRARRVVVELGLAEGELSGGLCGGAVARLFIPPRRETDALVVRRQAARVARDHAKDRIRLASVLGVTGNLHSGLRVRILGLAAVVDRLVPALFVEGFFALVLVEVAGVLRPALRRQIVGAVAPVAEVL